MYDTKKGRYALKRDVFPYNPPGETIMDWSVSPSAGGHFEVGAISNATAACLNYSLGYILQLGVEKIQAHRQPLLRRLQTELPRLGFQPLTPADRTSPIVAFAKEDTTEVAMRLKRTHVDSAVYPAPHSPLAFRVLRSKRYREAARGPELGVKTSTDSRKLHSSRASIISNVIIFAWCSYIISGHDARIAALCFRVGSRNRLGPDLPGSDSPAFMPEPPRFCGRHG